MSHHPRVEVFGPPVIPEVPCSNPGLGNGTDLIVALLHGNGSVLVYVHTDLGKHILN